MDVLYRRGRATARQVMLEMDGRPTYSTIRTQLRVLEHKGAVRHRAIGRVFVYTPVFPRNKAQRVELQRVVETFFGGSADDAMAMLSSDDFRVRLQHLGRGPR
jgi:predicted transcriptional regulator